MTHLKRLIETKNVAEEYIVGVCGVCLTDLQDWINTGRVPEIYAPTLANILDVSVQELYGSEPKFSATVVGKLEMPASIEMNGTVGHL